MSQDGTGDIHELKTAKKKKSDSGQSWNFTAVRRDLQEWCRAQTSGYCLLLYVWMNRPEPTVEPDQSQSDVRSRTIPDTSDIPRSALHRSLDQSDAVTQSIVSSSSQKMRTADSAASLKMTVSHHLILGQISGSWQIILALIILPEAEVITHDSLLGQVLCSLQQLWAVVVVSL